MFNYNYNQNYQQSNRQHDENADDEKNFETVQNARRDLIGELDAIVQYDDHLHKTDDELAKATWKNIRDEEMVHVGELLGLLNYLAPYQKSFVERGLREFEERAEKYRK